MDQYAAERRSNLRLAITKSGGIEAVLADDQLCVGRRRFSSDEGSGQGKTSEDSFHCDCVCVAVWWMEVTKLAELRTEQGIAGRLRDVRKTTHAICICLSFVVGLGKLCVVDNSACNHAVHPPKARQTSGEVVSFTRAITMM